MKKDRNSILQTYNSKVENQGKNKKTIKIAIIVVIVLLLTMGGVFAYLYLGTDTFLTSKQKFMKYFMQNIDSIENLDDSDIETYYKKVIEEAHLNNGEITLSVTGNFNEDEKKIIDEIQKHKIVFNGESDFKNNFFNQNIAIKYNDKDIIAGELINKGDYYGFKINDILSKYFIFENNNLKEFARKLEIADILQVPDKIDLMKLYEQNTFFTKEEIKELTDKYLNIIEDNLTDDMFSKNKQDNMDVYTISMNEKQAAKIVSALIDEFMNDQLILDKMKTIVMEKSQISEEEANQEIESFKTSLKDTKDYLSNENNFTGNADEPQVFLNIYTQKTKLLKTEMKVNNSGKIIIENKENGIKIDIYEEETENKLKELMSLNIEKIKTDRELTYKFGLTGEEGVSNLDLNLSYTGLSSMTDVDEKFNITFSSTELMGQNSILNKTKENQQTISNSQEKEQISLALNELVADVLKDNYVSGKETTVNETTIKQHIEKSGVNVTVTKNEDGSYKVETSTGNIYQVNSDGTLGDYTTSPTIENTELEQSNTNNENQTEESTTSEENSEPLSIFIEYTNNNKFGQITGKELTQESIYLLNDKNLEQLSNLFDQLATRTKNKLSEAYKGTVFEVFFPTGIDTNPTPTPTPTPTPSPANPSDVDKMEKESFNTTFMMYKGKKISGSVINSLIKAVTNSNKQSEHEVTLKLPSTKKGKTVTINKTKTDTKKVNIKTKKTYTVKVKTNNDGYVNLIEVTEN